MIGPFVNYWSQPFSVLLLMQWNVIHCRFGAYLISEEIVQGGEILTVSEWAIS